MLLTGQILDQLDCSQPRGMDEVLLALDRPAPAVLAALLSLELAGWARALPGRRYIRALARPSPEGALF